MLKRFTNYILKHHWLTALMTFVVTFIPIAGIFGIIVAAFMTLMKGVLEGTIFTLAATLPYLISFYTTSHEITVPLALWAAIGVAVCSNILTFGFAVMLRRGASWSVMLQVAALFGVLVISVTHLVYPNVIAWWGDQLHSYYKQATTMTKMLQNSVSSSQPSEAQMQAINITKYYATGLMAAAILFNALLQLLVARWWQAAVFNPGSLHKELQGIRLSQLAGFLFILSMVLSYFGNSVVLDIMPVVYLLFCIAGLSLIHYLFRTMKSPTSWVWLTIFYLTLIFSLPVSVIFVAILALSDIWLDIRQRFKKIQLK